MEINFRALRPDEVECRIGMVKDGGISLMLYKDARCDQNVLDETVGAMNWQRHHSRDNSNCIVSIWDEDKKQWVEKEDTGTESRTEAEKGLASDSFKRACFNWGIGRELYTTPFIWINGATKDDKFYVKEMEVENKRIKSLVICEKDKYGNPTDTVAYTYPYRKSMVSKKATKQEKATIKPEQAESIKQILMKTDSDVKAFLKNFKINSVDEMLEEDYPKAQRLLRAKVEQWEEKGRADE